MDIVWNFRLLSFFFLNIFVCKKTCSAFIHNGKLAKMRSFYFLNHYSSIWSSCIYILLPSQFFTLSCHLPLTEIFCYLLSHLVFRMRNNLHMFFDFWIYPQLAFKVISSILYGKLAVVRSFCVESFFYLEIDLLGIIFKLWLFIEC